MHLSLHLLLLLLLLQVCWGTTNGFCYEADIIAALDKAVADGVDVINLGVDSINAGFPDTVATALLQVASAGVFVVAAAGNGGPNPESVKQPAPWVTTVAASTHSRGRFRATAGLSRTTPGGRLLTLAGWGFYDGSLVVTPVVLAEKAARAGANLANA
jgi:subtilisin family serine protease